jgi:hypothetical protein
LFNKIITMSLTNQNNQKGKGGNKVQKNNFQASKFISKPSKAAGVSKKPVKTGGTRGS